MAEDAFWEAGGDPASWWTNGPVGRIFTQAVGDDSGRYNLTVWINGDSCDELDAMGEEAAGEHVLAKFQSLFPAASGRVSVGAVKSWALDPFSQGAWAVWKPGQIGSVPDLLQQPTGRIFFAGEHLGVSNPGMEGAMESGEQAALDVMRRLL